MNIQFGEIPLGDSEFVRRPDNLVFSSFKKECQRQKKEYETAHGDQKIAIKYEGTMGARIVRTTKTYSGERWDVVYVIGRGQQIVHKSLPYIVAKSRAEALQRNPNYKLGNIALIKSDTNK